MPLLRDVDTLTNYVDVDPPPLVTSPKSITQPVFANFDIHNVCNIAFTGIKCIIIASSLENQVGVTYSQQKDIRFKM
jgi:hypothetical protein